MKSDFLESAVFYEVYPTSFYDSDGDGVGDIRGVIQKLDYIKSLGANGIWLNPCFESPFRDGGYDISDYYSAGKRFGTNEDMRTLFDEAKKRGIRVLLDLVMGHSSDTHPWFLQSQRVEKNEYSDAYIWKPMDNPAESKDGQFLSGLSERRDMFRINYYAMQPALNYGYYKPKEPWQHAVNDDGPTKSRQRLIDVCCFWLSMGAAGFRVDMANYMVKNDKKGRANIAFWNDVIPRIKSKFGDAIFVSEWFNQKRSVGQSSFDIDFTSGYFLNHIWHGGNYENFSKNAYLGERGKHFFEGIVQIYYAKAAVKKRGYQAITIGNHDRERMSLGRSIDSMKLTFAFHLTMPHVPFVYYGDEIAMKYRHDIKTRDGGYQRTGSRTPMQWNNAKNRGFSNVEDPLAVYLPIDGEPTECVEAQDAKPDSLLETVRRLIALKRGMKCLGADAGFKVLRPNLSGLPYIFKRSSDIDEAITIIYPKKKEVDFSVRFLGDLGGFEIFANNLELKNGRAYSSGEGFAVLYRKK